MPCSCCKLVSTIKPPQDPTSPLARSSIVQILQKITEVPETWQVAIRNNGGGFVNHVIYWATMCPGGGGSPSGELLMQISRSFGSYVAFQEHFTSAASKLFGSGYVWLCENAKGDLVITSSKNQVRVVLTSGMCLGPTHLCVPVYQVVLSLVILTGLAAVRWPLPASCNGHMGACVLPQTPEQEGRLHSELVEYSMLG